MSALRRRLHVRGVVQGVGFRPRVHQLAHSLGLTGFVLNHRGSVVIEVEGPRALLDEFAERLLSLPRPVVVEALEPVELPVLDSTGFEIVAEVDAVAANDGPITNVLSPDNVWCTECQREFWDETNRRSRYVFTHCANCGPRYSITHHLPYERPHTSMGDFSPCEQCSREYTSPANRRFHAQNVACPVCGPKLQFELSIATPHLGDAPGRRCDSFASTALETAVEALRTGACLAVLGMGGYQLLVDATNDAAVARLRKAKRRPHKPLAVLFESLSRLESYCSVSPAEAEVLSGASGPIVLVDQLSSPSVPRSLSHLLTDTPRLGVLLPTTGLHAELVRRVGYPLVCTSGNDSGEPIRRTRQEAREHLSHIADAFLHHDRLVYNAVDDSVVHLVGGRPRLLRRARGYVPCRVAKLPTSDCVLALGGHQKNTFTLVVQGEACMSPHLCDLSTETALDHAERSLESWLRLYGAIPRRIVCDLNPAYGSTRLAERLAPRFGVPYQRVQHHHAHVAAVLAEHDERGAALGLAWDGFGLGPRGELWGGETLLCVGARAQHLGTIHPIALPGGPEVCSREPRRVALALACAIEAPMPQADAAGLSRQDLDRLEALVRSNVRSPRCSSMGRLFDGFAALFGGFWFNSYEGQAATRWMTLAESWQERAPSYPVSVTADGVFDWRPMLRAALNDQRVASPAYIARRFHESLAELALRVSDTHPDLPLVLAGGCFQNRLLLNQIEIRVGKKRRVLSPALVPANDGGLSLGQAWIAAQLP